MTGETVYTLENLTDFYRIAAMRMGARRYQIIRMLYLLGGAALILIGAYEGLDVLGGNGDAVVILLAVRDDEKELLKIFFDWFGNICDNARLLADITKPVLRIRFMQTAMRLPVLLVS